MIPIRALTGSLIMVVSSCPQVGAAQTSMTARAGPPAFVTVMKMPTKGVLLDAAGNDEAHASMIVSHAPIESQTIVQRRPDGRFQIQCHDVARGLLQPKQPARAEQTP